MERIAVKYGDYTIKPRQEQGWYPEENNYGYWVVKGGCNIMPGACWFHTVQEAQEGIRKLELAKGNADLFWLLMGNVGLTTYGRVDGSLLITAEGFKALRISARKGNTKIKAAYKNTVLEFSPAEALAMAGLLTEAAEKTLGKEI